MIEVINISFIIMGIILGGLIIVVGMFLFSLMVFIFIIGFIGFFMVIGVLGVFGLVFMNLILFVKLKLGFKKDIIFVVIELLI